MDEKTLPQQAQPKVVSQKQLQMLHKQIKEHETITGADEIIGAIDTAGGYGRAGVDDLSLDV